MKPSASILLVISHSPYSSLSSREALDAALTAAAFELPVSLLFIGDGTYCLLEGQDPSELMLKNLSKTLPALAMYDIDKLYCSRHSLEQRGLNPSQFVTEVTPLDDAQTAALFHQHEHILSF